MSLGRVLPLVLFVLLALGGGGLIGLTVETGGWYAGLDKPSFNPPDWAFGVVWTILYICIGIAGWRVWRAGAGDLQTLWWAQLVVNFSWPPVFFAAQALALAIALILALDVLIVLFIARAWARERIAALLFVPYALWTGYASALNIAIWWMNR
ncbi:TspO/MBR family protein [Fulvimarina sp. 2208YS6-2-32]|uniref:TspO/MBR family protein n=1 Tax=Fulvimarina uroteuthidis TaxID=3098149 RepID=A0ABU5HXW0_9HYPH|nr:TspO/MBR family protein [Fulvimarina sp. 2208YS6-2-32]MDY8107974.1 TspO/MBR family protein [Fulvimarina sp. 2208YS6-2-32]